ncbi:hypothetical protein MP478_04435 [Chryseobacterium sp. WG14]|uniref:hypothetical protein n=1 Tax=Chryseobacterium sp. WG14 TaxID=2926909 RepID=UPI00211E6D27|nr:hypothetical protein [Chryseobacterium sp. WG14]MCQ9638628.1 hypothetical protein [Chryseobacterium sp. WG14]
MSHTEKQNIFNQLSQNICPETIRQGQTPLDQFEDWEDVLIAFRYSNISLQSVTKLIFEACDLVQQEQQRRIAESVKALRVTILNPENIIQ